MSDMSVAFAGTRCLTDLGRRPGSQVDPRPSGEGVCR